MYYPIKQFNNKNALWGLIDNPKTSTNEITYYGNYYSIENIDITKFTDEILIWHRPDFSKEEWRYGLYGIKTYNNSNFMEEKNVLTIKLPKLLNTYKSNEHTFTNIFNILIRYTYENSSLIKKCIDSILHQSYTNYNIIICYDDNRCLKYLKQYKKNISIFKINKENEDLYFYNSYYNYLLDKVTRGWIIFLNDLDMFVQPNSLEIINKYIKTENDVIFWKFKMGKNIIFPNINNIKLETIISSGFCLHSKFKNNKWSTRHGNKYIPKYGSGCHYITNLINNFLVKKQFIPNILTQTISKEYSIIKTISKTFPYLFHKYKLNIQNFYNKINYSIIQNNFSNSMLYAHLHCYNIDKFEEIYGIYISQIDIHFNIIITYCIGNNIPNLYTVLKIPNKGQDIGAKFCMINYLLSNNIIYTHILFLHSKSNVQRRTMYFDSLINNLDSIVNERNNYDGVFPDMKWLINEKFSTNKRGETIWEVNNIYRNELLDYLEIEDKNKEFIEGNVYFLTKKVSEKLFGDPILYNILNKPIDFDYNYIINKYKIQDNPEILFQQFPQVNILTGENYGNIEQSFERVVLNCCEKSRIVYSIKPIILIDCQCLQHETRGIGCYGVNLVNTLIENNKDYKILLLINNFLEEELLNRIKLKNNTSFTKCYFNNIENPKDHERSIYYNNKEYIYEEKLASFINNINPFIYLNISEFDRRKVALNKSLLINKNIKTYCILHDLIPFKKKLYDNLPEWKNNYNKQIESCHTYTKLLTNSKFTLSDSIDIFNNMEYLGTGVNNINVDIDNITSKKILHKYNIYKSYIFSQSAFDLHKGFDILYNIYNNLPKSFKEKYLLVIGSAIPDDYFDNIPDNVIITGYLSSEELSVLHKNAWLFVYPSQYEGFGIPPVEAWWHNVPAIVARNTSLVEVMDNTEYTFTNDTLSDLLIKLDNDNLFYNNCLKHGIIQKTLFNWNDVIKRLNTQFKIKLSIVILVKNNEKWLEHLNTYFYKTEKLYNDLLEFEYFIYENNSTDKTKIIVHKFMKNRKGKFICENISTTYKWTEGIDINRGLHMNYIRNRAKNRFGKINSDYILLLDSDTILERDTIFRMVYYIHQDETIGAITPFVKCKHGKLPLHYYDSLAVVTNSNINYIKNDNTCMFKHCERCTSHRKIKNINLSKEDLFSITSEEISVKSAFGSCCLIKSYIYNKCEYDEKLFVESNNVCEHISFNKQILKYGRIIIKPDIRIVNKEFK
tara:strand:+ start:2644 stop:6348 length:3705 start_codon:yes stop_codon:yes gene_type:complete